MTCKACGQPYGCDHSDAEYQGIVPGPISSADRRGLDWFTRWIGFGCDLSCDESGNLQLVAPRTAPKPEDLSEIMRMRSAIQSDPLLAHAVGRTLIDYWKWDAVVGGRVPGNG
jgi:hypothetical protein